MLSEIYIEALLADEEAADRVWEAWDKGGIDEDQAIAAWISCCTLTSRANNSGGSIKCEKF